MTEVLKEAGYSTDRPPITVYYYVDNSMVDLTNLMTTTTVSGDISQAFRKCAVEITNTVDGRTQLIDIKLEGSIRVLYGKTEIFRGKVMAYDIDDKGNGAITAYDVNYYLTRSSDTSQFYGKKASQVIKELCAKYRIPVGTIADTGYVIPELNFRDGKSVYDMMIVALTETLKKNNRKFSLISYGGKLYLTERKKQLKRIVLEDGHTLISASYRRTNENRQTRVRVVGKSGSQMISATIGNDASIRSFGVMQHLEKVTEETNQAAINALARRLLNALDTVDEEFDVEALGVYDVISGTAVVVNEQMTGLDSAFYVQSDTHTYSAEGLHTMSLKLSRTLDIPREDYVAPQEESSETTSGTADVTEQFSGKTYDSGFIGTAYDPKLGGINADSNPSVTATSTKWAYNRTIAVSPKVIPYGSVVHVVVPGAPEFSGIYLAEDTGGAIRNENGGKRVDVLIQGKSATAKFGRRNVQVAILERGKGPADARSKASRWSSIVAKYKTQVVQTSSGGSSKADAVVALGRSYIGRLRYDFGGKNIPSGRGDCSGYTYYVYKKAAGVDIGHGTSVQDTKGREVPKSDARPGDLVMFENTYRRGVSHVGIVTKPGYFVSLASSGCYETSYLTGPYWPGKFRSIRRVL